METVNTLQHESNPPWLPNTKQTFSLLSLQSFSLSFIKYQKISLIVWDQLRTMADIRVRFKRVAEAFDGVARARLCESSGSEHSPENYSLDL